MKISSILSLALVFFSIATFQSCKVEDDGIPRFTPTDEIPTIFDIIQENENLDSLEIVLTRVNLIDIFKDSSYTLFAPNNQAFANYLSARNLTKITDVSDSKWTEFMLYHTLWYRITSDSLKQDQSLATLDPFHNIVIDRRTGLQLVTTDTNQGPINVITTDIAAQNGLVNLVDDILSPITSNQPTPTIPTIADIAIQSGQTDSLVVALTRANLVTTFQSAGTYTVFAPNNQAFVDLLASRSNWNAISDIPIDTLTAVLQYHVLATEVTSNALTDDTYATTINTQGPDNTATVIEVDVTGGVKLNNNATVILADQDASNGVVHVIDAVIMPRNIVQLASNDERFTSLVAALTAYPSFTYVNTLSGTGPFTVFAPTNAAFDALLATDPTWNTVGDIPDTTLMKVLEYHVVSGNTPSGSLSQGQVIPTLGGSNLTVDLTNGAQLETDNINQGPVNIIVTDVQGINGVIHAVDSVLLPVL